MRKIWNPLERFLRVLIAYGVVFGAAAILRGTAGIEVPAFLIPILSAGLNALAKWFRDKWGLDIQV